MSTDALSMAGHAASSSRRLPGDRDVWVFILAELMMFGAFFVAYAVAWAGDPTGFAASQLTLDRDLALLNTLFLIVSSWAVANAVNAARISRGAAVAPYLALAIGLGLAFMMVKYLEYSAKINAGISITGDDFYMFYFCLTGIHLLHVVAGTIILGIMWNNARQGHYHAANLMGLEAGASYWHMVDLLWIFLFALIYLLR